jgi:hypothetical protein
MAIYGRLGVYTRVDWEKLGHINCEIIVVLSADVSQRGAQGVNCADRVVIKVVVVG